MQKAREASMSIPRLTLLAALAAHARYASALPSYGTRFPNGQSIPCPPNGEGCDNSGICRGVGHPTCSGGISGASPQLLNPFGEDFRDAGFRWTEGLCLADSDGDGLSNGEELGDPCCVWTVEGSVLALKDGLGVAPYTASFVPTHPGAADHFAKDYVRPACGTADTSPSFLADDAAGDDENEDGPLASNGISGYGPSEVRASFDLVMPPFEIPARTTTYIDVIFNLPEDLPGLVHIVYGEALVSQPRHLHHFVVTGCSERVPEEENGRPVAGREQAGNCQSSVGGLSAWAPGSTLWGFGKDVGVPIGEDFGIVALQVNVHYTDGDAPYLNGTNAIATDGIRVHYTPDLRPRTATSTPVINVPAGPDTMSVEANKDRVFMTRTCTVQSRCVDTPDDQMGVIGRRVGDPSLTCSKGAAFCALGGRLEMYKMACPATCGVCSEEEVSPRNPGEYGAVGVFYHAHLLGTEMYTTLIPFDDPEARIDLKSMPVWTYEDQPMYPLDIALRPGDKIQSTCVFDSTGRDKKTEMGLSTYDEMCLNTVTVVLDTPALESDGGGRDVSPAMDIQLRGFACEVSPSSDVWLGELSPEEDGLLVADLHPLGNAGCSFPTGPAVMEGIPSFDRRCGGLLDGEAERGGLCDPGSRLAGDEVAGASCNGGEHNEKDSNDGTTEEQCTEGGGVWSPYTCSLADRYRRGGRLGELGENFEEYIVETWYAPKCCVERGSICDRVPASFVKDDENAGASCTGGTFDEKDSNDGTTEEQCANGGGTWTPYTCAEINEYQRLGNFESLGEEVEQYLINEWYAPKCCAVTEDDSETNVQDEEKPVDVDDVDDVDAIATTPSSAGRSATSWGALATVGCMLLLASFVPVAV